MRAALAAMRQTETRVGLHEDGCRTVLVSEAHNESFCGRSTVLPVSATIDFIHGVVPSGRAAELLDCIVAVRRPRQPAGKDVRARAGRLRGGKWCSSDGRGVGCVPLGRWQRTRRVAHASDECAIEQRARIVFPKCNAFASTQNGSRRYGTSGDDGRSDLEECELY
jgi:hypothetical protein